MWINIVNLFIFQYLSKNNINYGFLVAVAIGATIIERHITINRNLWGTDQSSSVEIEGMDSLYKRIQGVEKILGAPIKRVTESELPIKEKLRG